MNLKLHTIPNYTQIILNKIACLFFSLCAVKYRFYFAICRLRYVVIKPV